MVSRQAFVSCSAHALAVQKFSASKSQFVAPRCVTTALRYRNRNETYQYVNIKTPLSTGRDVVHSSMEDTDNLREYDEADLDAEIELTEEELKLCGEFRPDLPLLNTVVLTGRLGADPTVRNVGDDLKVCNFAMAVTTEYDPDEGPNQERTSWFDIEAWGSTAEYIAKYAKKGMRVGVTGPINVNAWMGRDGEERQSPIVTAESFEILQSRSEQMPPIVDSASPYASHERGSSRYGTQDSGMGTTQDLKDLPF